MNIASINDLPNLPISSKKPEIKSIKEIISELFIWLYSYILTHENSPIISTLKSDIKNHFEKYESENPRVCPFCGLENIKLLASEGRADYDHYFHKTFYPFSSVNLENLVPIGVICNKIKGTKNVLIDEKGDRTMAFYPFSFDKKYGQDYEFELDCLKKPSSSNKNGEWKIRLAAISSDKKLKIQLETWNRIFNIQKRYEEHIEKGHKSWLKAIIFTKDISKAITISQAKVISDIQKLIENTEPTQLRISSNTEIIPRFLYYKFLKNDAVFATELLQLFVEKPHGVDEDLLEL